MSAGMPVSYTHLDVYKRQAEGFRRQRWKDGFKGQLEDIIHPRDIHRDVNISTIYYKQNPVCLLYTSLKKVNKSYGAQKVLDDITVTLERGRVHGFVGRNGSGKTILMKCIAGLARPDSGEVLVDGRHIGTELENPPDMGAIIEVPGFLPNASGYKNLKYLADISGRAGDKEIQMCIRDRVYAWLVSS